jgi:uroporphyrinogen III methyltransferase/synthase
VTVYLVGAGPGDPGLLTVRGAQLLARADVVVYDRLSVASLLDLAPEDAERIGVGKAPGNPTMIQEDINALLIERGRAGLEVVRLKGGDPFVFARGGEEAQAMADAGVTFEVVPGITSAIAAPAYAGVPLTLRHSSTLFTVITGHEDPDKGGELDWGRVAELGGTIVVLMGVGRLPKIVGRLLAGGLAPETPVVSVQWGTRPEQRTVRATLGTILEHEHELAAPSTIVIGRVAGLDLAWFESRPLFGQRVVVTRARPQASELVAALRAQGADTVEAPVIEIGDPADGGASLSRAVGEISSYHWVVFTSANAVRRFFARVRDARDLAGVRVAAIGAGTSRALADHRVVADLVPDRFVAESLIESFPAPSPGGGRVLVPRAAVARDVLPDALRAGGWQVDVVEAYRTYAVPASDDLRQMVADAGIVTFTSSSTVKNFVTAFGVDAVPRRVACIGPITAATAREHGLRVDVEAATHTVAGLVDALVAAVGGWGAASDAAS